VTFSQKRRLLIRVAWALWAAIVVAIIIDGSAPWTVYGAYVSVTLYGALLHYCLIPDE
jgi:hypothetical protein